MSRFWLRLFGFLSALGVLVLPLISLASGSLPGLLVTPLVLDFGQVAKGSTSAAQTVTITNTGTAALTNFAGGAPFDSQFGASQNCVSGVAPGASCQYTFAFSPTAVGIYTTTSEISTNAGPITIALRGEGVGPKMSASPLDLDFGKVLIGSTSAAQSTTIRNVGQVALANFAGGAPFNSQFSASQNCAGGVAVGASCQYIFTFSPTSAGVFTTTSETSTNAGPVIVTLRGEGVSSMPTGAHLVASPLVLNFGPVGVGATSASQTVTIKNIGDTALTSFVGGMPDDSQFTASQNCAGGVAVGASCQYTFKFSPTSAGVYTATSETTTNAGPVTVTLWGEGVGPHLQVSPQELDFGDVALGSTSAVQVVTITNTGSSTLTSFVGGMPDNPQFVASQNCAAGVAPGASCQYTFKFSPTSAGLYTATSETSTNAGTFSITLHGQSGSMPPSAQLSFAPDDITRGDVTRMSLTLGNQNRSLVVDDVAFAIALPAGVRVAATPDASLSDCGTATIAATAGASTISLSGGRILLSGQCQIGVNVTATSAGSYAISTGAIASSNSGTGSGASAVLQVQDPVLRTFLPLVRR